MLTPPDTPSGRRVLPPQRASGRTRTGPRRAASPRRVDATLGPDPRSIPVAPVHCDDPFVSSGRRGGAWARRAAAAALAAGLVVAAGCSMVGRLGYDHFPTLAAWRADSYLSLNAEQKAIASRRIEALHAWHRSTQLDDYAGLLREVRQALAAGDVDEARIRGWRLAMFERWKPIADRAAPGVAEVAVSLEPAQLQRLRDGMERDNDRIRREWLPPGRAERIEARTRRYVERAEQFLGALTAEQRQLARRMAAEVPDGEEQWFAQRLLRQQDLVATFERIRAERPDPATATAWMRAHLMRYAQVRDGPGRPFSESSLAASDAMSARMLELATPKQRQHLQRKLQEWIDLIESLRPAETARSTGAPVAAN